MILRTECPLWVIRGHYAVQQSIGIYWRHPVGLNLVESHQEIACTPQIRCSCPFSEPPVDWFNQISRLIDSFLPPPKLCEAHSRSQFQRLGILTACQVNRVRKI